MIKYFFSISMLLFAIEGTTQKEFFDLAYLPTDEITEDTLQRLNLFLPKADKAPLMLWIGGGAWSYVNRNMESDLGRNFAKAGIAVAAVGHRLSAAAWRDPNHIEGVQHPKHIEDIASAFKWLVDHSEDYGYDGSKIIIGGFSSGAHLAALLAMDDQYLKAVGLSLDRIVGVIAISGAYDIAAYHEVFASGSTPSLAVEHVESVFGSTPEGWIAASPITYIDQLKAPMLLMTDNRVDRYTRSFDEALSAAHYENVDVVYINGLDHGPLWRNIGQAAHSRYRDMMVSFIRSIDY